jgi:hypothetical protein
LLGHFGRKSSETLGFPGKMRKRHAETAESSGKSRINLIEQFHFGFRAEGQQVADGLPLDFSYAR